MIKNYLLITLRSMMKSKLYISINLLGMAIAIACCIVAYYNYDFNASFDEVHENASRIYRVNMSRTFQEKTTEYGIVPIPLGEVIRQNVSDAELVTRYSAGYADIKMDDEIFDSRLTYIDPEFFKLFTFSFIKGDPSSISRKSSLLISEELAERLFGTEDPMGKNVSQIMADGTVRDFEITAVFKMPPANSSFYDQAFTLYDNYWVTVWADMWRYGSHTSIPNALAM